MEVCCKKSCNSYLDSDFRRILDAASLKLSEYSNDTHSYLSYAFKCDKTEEFQELYLLKSALERHYFQVIFDETPCLCDHDVQSLIERIKDHTGINCTNDSSTTLRVDESEFSNWAVTHPNCVSLETWEQCLYKVCGDIKFDLNKVSEVIKSCMVQYQILPQQPISIDVCKVNFDILKSVRDCDITFSQYVNLINCGITHDSIISIVDCEIPINLISTITNCNIGFNWDVNESSGECDPNTQLGVSLNVEALLQGAWNSGTGSMNTTLNSSGYLPLTQPYNIAPYFYQGTEQVQSFDADVVDWVLISLRKADDSSVLITMKAALLKSNGQIVSTDGSTSLSLMASKGSYLVALHHRNHLDIHTDLPVDFSLGSAVVDFTQGTSGTKQLSPGVHAMYQGDVNKDHRIINNNVPNPDEDSDRYRILEIVGVLTPNNIIAGYNVGDVNMDGFTKYNGPNNDKNEVLEAVGILTPTNIIVGQFYGI